MNDVQCRPSRLQQQTAEHRMAPGDLFTLMQASRPLNRSLPKRLASGIGFCCMGRCIVIDRLEAYSGYAKRRAGADSGGRTIAN
jgi:hypothetical protein